MTAIVLAMRRPGRFQGTLDAWRPVSAGPSSGRTNPFDEFDGIFCINLDADRGRWADAQERHRQLGIAGRVERLPAVATPTNHHVGCALSWRELIGQAETRGYTSVLGLEDDAIFLDDSVTVLDAAVTQLDGLVWDLLYLGGALHGGPTEIIPGRPALRRCGYVACTHALAVHRLAFPRILADVPSGRRAMRDWIDRWGGIDQYFASLSETGAVSTVLVSPQIAVQAELLGLPYGEYERADRYTI
jgi:hypothetical protein